jgi:hypothetical protein
MRLLAALAVTVFVLAPAQAQTRPSIGPGFAEKSVRADAFDAVFEVKVTLVPAVPLLLGQTPDARFDAVVCNADNSGEGWVRVDPKARWGVLKAGTCTMFAGFRELNFAPIDADHLWTAKVYLRAKR